MNSSPNSINKTQLVIILSLFLLYTLVYSAEIGGIAGEIALLIPGIVGVVYLMSVGFRKDELGLQPKRISKKGLLALILFSVVLIPILASGKFVGFNFLSFFIIAPLSGFGQELFFRATLLPSIVKIAGKDNLGILFQSILFVIWHLPVAIRHAPIPGVIALSVVTFIGGIIWGYVANRERTIFGNVIAHSIYLMSMSLFVW